MDFEIEKVCALKWKMSIFYTDIRILLLLVHIIHGREIFYPVQSCTDITLAQIPEEVYQKCLENDRVIHCLPNDDDVLGLSCFSIVWIAKGNLDEKPCTGDAELCPPKQFKSPSSVLYKGCYIKEPTTRATPTIATTTHNETMLEMTSSLTETGIEFSLSSLFFYFLCLRLFVAVLKVHYIPSY
ncbi:uncharacterized protein LOC125664076 isoform X2 [Ostrea edulis]|uniref:uncharacterized protein LOC125664076 isoform X2 n=1 Tax=Ostrea edulis TaxID=37623 RepID=UPI0024AE9473|nr:uncharacterized protein LOC125664076 isoform X2 [Ostrea edulis]